MTYYKKTATLIQIHNTYEEMAGISFNKSVDRFLMCISLSCASYKLGRIDEAIAFLQQMQRAEYIDGELREYYHLVGKYLSLKKTGAEEQIIRSVLSKFYEEKYVAQLYGLLEQGGTPYDRHLLNCDYKRCEQCEYRDVCSYNEAKDVIRRVGQVYARFRDGQAKEAFQV